MLAVARCNVRGAVSCHPRSRPSSKKVAFPFVHLSSSHPHSILLSRQTHTHSFISQIKASPSSTTRRHFAASMTTTLVQTAVALDPPKPDVSLDSYDEEQVRLMEERCILVDENDKAYGEDSKKTCHLMTNISSGLLHRAFSVFLFRPSDGRLLLQRRADEKITFPSMWTNTCCSHPLSIRAELVEEGQSGVRAAAIRKLPHELGIPPAQLTPEMFTYLTRIHYLAPSDGLWGEHEIDYILFCAADVDLEINPNEVSDARYVSKQELEEMFANPQNSFTPWFRLIARDLLFPWWDEMVMKSRLEGWNPEKGVGKVNPRVLEDGKMVDKIMKMV